MNEIVSIYPKYTTRTRCWHDTEGNIIVEWGPVLLVYPDLGGMVTIWEGEEDNRTKGGKGTMESKYIKFVKVGQRPKTAIWQVKNKKSDFTLGVIEWYPPWRQYTFTPDLDTIFNDSCLIDIAQFMTEAK